MACCAAHDAVGLLGEAVLVFDLGEDVLGGVALSVDLVVQRCAPRWPLEIVEILDGGGDEPLAEEFLWEVLEASGEVRRRWVQGLALGSGVLVGVDVESSVSGGRRELLGAAG